MKIPHNHKVNKNKIFIQSGVEPREHSQIHIIINNVIILPRKTAQYRFSVDIASHLVQHHLCVFTFVIIFGIFELSTY